MSTPLQTRRVFCAMVWIEDVSVVEHSNGQIATHVGKHNDIRMLSFSDPRRFAKEMLAAMKELDSLPPKLIPA